MTMIARQRAPDRVASRAANLAGAGPKTMQMAMSPTAVDRNPGLDALRGLACLLVVGFHYFSVGTFAGGRVLMYLFAPGWSGVDLFFVLSGYLVGGQLLDARATPGNVETFYIRRVARTWPLYFLLLLTVAATGNGVIPWQAFVFLQNVLWSTTDPVGASWIQPTWSLAIEEQFYLLLPAAVLLLRRRQLAFLLTIVLLAALLLRAFLVNSTASYYLLPCRADELALGIGVAMAMRDQKARAWLASHLDTVSVLTLGLGAVGFGAIMAGRPDPVMLIGIPGLVYAGLLVLVVLGPARSVPGIGRVGAWSYPLYLFHGPIGSSVVAALGHSLAAGLIALLLAVGVSAALHLTIERPIHRWARRHYAYRQLSDGLAFGLR
jgi:peptidoglycan/LPS O-acetylase OafA/YrhL